MMTYDFKAALTSLSQKWLLAVLEAMGVPTGLIQMMRRIYAAAGIYFCVFGKCGYVSRVTSG
eukprot:2818422-Karenia_brevis.AAC.1